MGVGTRLYINTVKLINVVEVVVTQAQHLFVSYVQNTQHYYACIKNITFDNVMCIL